MEFRGPAAGPGSVVPACATPPRRQVWTLPSGVRFCTEVLRRQRPGTGTWIPLSLSTRVRCREPGFQCAIRMGQRCAALTERGSGAEAPAAKLGTQCVKLGAQRTAPSRGTPTRSSAPPAAPMWSRVVLFHRHTKMAPSVAGATAVASVSAAGCRRGRRHTDAAVREGALPSAGTPAARSGSTAAHCREGRSPPYSAGSPP